MVSKDKVGIAKDWTQAEHSSMSLPLQSMQDMNQFLIALCGLPSSGKTTLARAIKEQIDSDTRVEIVSTDRWRDEAFYSDFKPEKEHLVRRDALENTSRLILEGVSVIHDDTNYYTSMRHELFDIAGKNKTVFAVIHVSTPVELAVQWNSLREKPVPNGVIEKIEDRFDIPGSKYAWDRPIATHNLGIDDIREAASKIVERLESLQPVSTHTTLSEQSIGNLLDVITRQVVKQFLDANPSFRKNPSVSKIRRSTLALARTQQLSSLETEQRLKENLEDFASKA